MNQEESIYNLIPRESPEKEKLNRHKSKFRRMVVDEFHSNKNANKTLGPAKVETRPPDLFLKKHEKEPKLPPRPGRNQNEEERRFHYPDADAKRPPVPGRDERPVMGLRTNKDFITENALQNITAVPRKPERISVDTRHGDKMALEPSGLEPRHIHKKDYGVTPTYVIKRKEEMKVAQEQYDSYVAEHFRRGTMKQLTKQERTDILTGLKENWERLHRDYLHLSVMIDTVPKINYKEKLELELKQLEKDIEMMEVHNVIYIAN
jgi:hypothetical protein